uniref:Uncharacterized protein n=1 Tax=Aegilops tauschii TaxID=37682 RepID=M8BW85_AEGTA
MRPSRLPRGPFPRAFRLPLRGPRRVWHVGVRVLVGDRCLGRADLDARQVNGMHTIFMRCGWQLSALLRLIRLQGELVDPGVFVFPYEDHGEYGTSACVYSSETGAWGEPTSTRDKLMGCIQYSCVVVGSSLLYFVLYDYKESWSILEYDLSSHSLTVFIAPDNHCDCLYNLVLTEDDGLGVIQHLHRHLKSQMVGFAEGANAIIVSTISGLFAIELQSEQVRKVCDQCCFLNVVPVVTFYTPVPRGNHQNLLLSKPGEECVEEEKTINQAQQLVDHGSNAIKEGDFVNTSESIRHDHYIR